MLFLFWLSLALQVYLRNARGRLNRIETHIFPHEEFYVSYHWLKDEGNNADKCVASALNGAQSMLATSIFSEVSSTTQSTATSVTQGDSYSESETFYNEFSVAASAQLVNVSTEHYYDASTKTAHALAYVKKLDLSKFCEDKLKADMASLNGKLKSIEELVGSGHKNEAKKITVEAIGNLGIHPVYLSQLIAIGKTDLNTSDISAQYERVTKELLRYKSDLEHGISIYVQASLSSPFMKSETLSNRCKGVLSDKGCKFVSSAEEADYAITIDCTTRTSSSSGDMWFAFSDVNITVTRNRDGIVMYDDALSIKGGGGTEERAHRKALDSSPKQICDKIINCIQQ